jgi:hypothetical protein
MTHDTKVQVSLNLTMFLLGWAVTLFNPTVGVVAAILALSLLAAPALEAVVTAAKLFIDSCRKKTNMPSSVDGTVSVVEE